VTKIQCSAGTVYPFRKIWKKKISIY